LYIVQSLGSEGLLGFTRLKWPWQPAARLERRVFTVSRSLSGSHSEC